MADTIRSTDDLLNASTGLFKDNTAGDITAQRLRDFVLSTYRPQAVNGFRLTLTTATPVTTSDVTGATTLYWTPYVHNCIGLYDGTSWKQWASAELSLALGTLTSGANYDVFVYDSSGTLTLKLGPAWSSGTARGTGAGTTELTTQDGVYVNTNSISGGPGAKAGRYLGTIRTTSTTATESSAAKRFVWNASNRVGRRLLRQTGTANWTYATTATWRQANADTANKVEFVLGLGDPPVVATVKCLASHSTGQNTPIGLGLDSTTANSADLFGAYSNTAGSSLSSPLAIYRGYPGIGYHYLAWIERVTVSATATFYGFSSGEYTGGITGEVVG